MNTGTEFIQQEHLTNIQCWEFPKQRKSRKQLEYEQRNKVREKKDNLTPDIIADYHSVADYFKFINHSRDKS